MQGKNVPRIFLNVFKNSRGSWIAIDFLSIKKNLFKINSSFAYDILKNQDDLMQVKLTD